MSSDAEVELARVEATKKQETTPPILIRDTFKIPLFKLWVALSAINVVGSFALFFIDRTNGDKKSALVAAIAILAQLIQQHGTLRQIMIGENPPKAPLSTLIGSIALLVFLEVLVLTSYRF